MPSGSPTVARLMVVLAAVLWSAGSFMKVFNNPTPLGLHEPELKAIPIAFWRGLFAGLALVPLVRFQYVRFRPIMFGMVACFAVMSCVTRATSDVAHEPGESAERQESRSKNSVHAHSRYFERGMFCVLSAPATKPAIWVAPVVSKCVWSSQKNVPTAPVVLALTSPPGIGQSRATDRAWC